MIDIDVRNAERKRAPDKSTVYLLGAVGGAGTAVFELPAHAVARAVRHPRVEEVWYVLSGEGELWRRTDDGKDLGVASLIPGWSLVLPRGTSFQFRNQGEEPLRILGVTSPLWEGDHDAQELPDPRWPPTL